MIPIHVNGWDWYTLPCTIESDYDNLYPLHREPFAGWRVRATQAVRRGLWP